MRLRDDGVYHKKYAYGTIVVNRFSATHSSVNGKNGRRVLNNRHNTAFTVIISWPDDDGDDDWTQPIARVRSTYFTEPDDNNENYCVPP